MNQRKYTGGEALAILLGILCVFGVLLQVMDGLGCSAWLAIGVLAVIAALSYVVGRFVNATKNSAIGSQDSADPLASLFANRPSPFDRVVMIECRLVSHNGVIGWRVTESDPLGFADRFWPVEADRNQFIEDPAAYYGISDHMTIGVGETVIRNWPVIKDGDRV